MNAASRVSDCRPLPPRPTSSAWPPGWRMILQMRATCSTANVKRTRLMGALELALYSARYSVTVAARAPASVSST